MSKLERFGITPDQTILEADYESTTFSGAFTGQEPEVVTRVRGYTFSTNKVTLELINQAPSMLEALIEMLVSAEKLYNIKGFATTFFFEYYNKQVKVIEKALGEPWDKIKEIWEREE